MIYPWQLKPLQSYVASLFFQHKHVMVILPRQEGKTELGVRLGGHMISQPLTRTGLFLTKSKKAAKKMTREKSLRLFEPATFQVNTELIYNKKCPTAAIFIDSVDKDPSRIRGGTYHYIHWAEVAFSEFEEGVTTEQVFHTVIKPTQKNTHGYSFLESTPNGDDGWKELFENAKSLGYFPIRMPLSKLVEMGLYDEGHFLEIKSQTPDLMFRQEYECEFVSFSGVVYEEMKPHHIWADMPAPESWHNVFIAIDWGYDPSATCITFAYIQDGRICVFDEIYEKKLLIPEIAQAIKDRMNKWNILRVSGVGDHEPRSIEELTRLGVPVSPCKKVDVLGNRMEIKTKFLQNKLYIHPRCKFVLKDLGAATWDLKKRGEIEYARCSWGHFDGEASLRYLVRAFEGFNQASPVQLPHSPNTVHEMALRRQ